MQQDRPFHKHPRQDGVACFLTVLLCQFTQQTLPLFADALEMLPRFFLLEPIQGLARMSFQVRLKLCGIPLLVCFRTHPLHALQHRYQPLSPSHLANGRQ